MPAGAGFPRALCRLWQHPCAVSGFEPLPSFVPPEHPSSDGSSPTPQCRASPAPPPKTCTPHPHPQPPCSEQYPLVQARLQELAGRVAPVNETNKALKDLCDFIRNDQASRSQVSHSFSQTESGPSTASI